MAFRFPVLFLPLLCLLACGDDGRPMDTGPASDTSTTVDSTTPPTPCTSDQECTGAERCDPCATSSCPTCEDCIAGCVPHGCESETMLTCRCARPDCGEGNVSIIRDGCWVCVDAASCGDTTGGCGGA